MTPTLSFLCGFLCAGVLCCILASWYYVRARRRVRSIARAIEDYQQANALVGDAVKRTFVEPKR